MNKRLQRLRGKLRQLDLDSFIVSSLHNIRWLTGYTGSNGLAVAAPRSAYFLTDFRYTVQARKQTANSGFKLVISKRDLVSSLDGIRPSVYGERVGFESDAVTCEQLKAIRKMLKGKKLVGRPGIVQELRLVKDRRELNRLRKAVKITDEVFEEVLPLVKPGITEVDLMSEIEYLFHKKGAYASFETIIASGYRGAMPHGMASKKVIKKGEMITFDFGGVYDGYTSDMTRTVVLGKATPKQKKIYEIVLRAQLAAIDSIKSGIAAKDVDAVARDIITEEGYGPNFGHSLGHGIGICVQGDRLHIHEEPILSPRSNRVLEEGNVVTVEPGIYIPGWGGVRIEDDVIVTGNGCSIMNKSPKHLIEL